MTAGSDSARVAGFGVVWFIIAISPISNALFLSGVLLAERTAEHEALFRDGVEAEFFEPDDPEDLAAKVRGLLQDDARREAIRRAGREAVERGGHTYRDRLERLFELHARQAGGVREGAGA